MAGGVKYGTVKNYFTVTWVNPDDPRHDGLIIYYRYPNGDTVQLSGKTAPDQTSHYFEFDAPSTIVKGSVYALSVGKDGKTNTYVPGWTPEVPMQIGTDGGTLNMGQAIEETLAPHLGVTSGVLGVLPGSITEELVQNYALTNISLADGAAITRVLADGAVDTDKLADLAVASAKLANSAVTSTKLNDLAVEAAKLANSAVTSTKIANAAVGSAAIANAAVGSAAIANLAVGTAALDNAVITNAKLDHASVNRIAIVDADIVNLAAAKINAGTLGVGVVYAGTINANQINAGILNGHTITGSSLTLNLNGVTTTIANSSDGIDWAGIICKANASSLQTSLSPSGVLLKGSAGHESVRMVSGGSGGYLHVKALLGASGVEINGAAISVAGSAGLTGTATLAKLTSGGANGSISFTSGIVTAYSAPT